jgi:hypothetical protein
MLIETMELKMLEIVRQYLPLIILLALLMLVVCSGRYRWLVLTVYALILAVLVGRDKGVEAAIATFVIVGVIFGWLCDIFDLNPENEMLNGVPTARAIGASVARQVAETTKADRTALKAELRAELLAELQVADPERRKAMA